MFPLLFLNFLQWTFFFLIVEVRCQSRKLSYTLVSFFLCLFSFLFYSPRMRMSAMLSVEPWVFCPPDTVLLTGNRELQGYKDETRRS